MIPTCSSPHLAGLSIVPFVDTAKHTSCNTMNKTMSKVVFCCFCFFQSATDCVKKSKISYKPLPIEKCESVFSFDLTVG